MILVDCFIPAMTHVIETLRAVNGSTELDYAAFRQKVLQLLRDNATYEQAVGYDEAHYQNALFAAVSFIDEQVMNSQWNQKSLWGAELLQRHFFNTTRGGVEFFARLDALNPYHPVDRDIREVYFYCLALGFAGQYYRPGDKAQLADMITANADILCAHIKTDHLLESSANSGKPTAIPAARVRIPRTPFYVGVPLLLMVCLFIAYRQGILTAVNDLLMAI